MHRGLPLDIADAGSAASAPSQDTGRHALGEHDHGPDGADRGRYNAREVQGPVRLSGKAGERGVSEAGASEV